MEAGVVMMTASELDSMIVFDKLHELNVTAF
jgi:hypothetical protein